MTLSYYIVSYIVRLLCNNRATVGQWQIKGKKVDVSYLNEAWKCFSSQFYMQYKKYFTYKSKASLDRNCNTDQNIYDEAIHSDSSTTAQINQAVGKIGQNEMRPTQ